MDTPWIAKDADGSEIGSGKTDGEGKFRVVPPKPVVSDITITVDTREGHIASAVVAATRFAGGGGAPTPPPDAGEGPAPPPDPATPAGAITAESVETAVQRQIEPLLERIEEMDSRLRFTDALSGIFLIVGARRDLPLGEAALHDAAAGRSPPPSRSPPSSSSLRCRSCTPRDRGDGARRSRRDGAGRASGKGRFWRRLLHVETFVLLLFLTLPFTVAGRPVLEFGPLTASAEGFTRAALVACKVSACVLVLLAFLGGLEPERMGGALRGLRLPEPLVRMFVLTVRYLGLIREEAGRLHDSMRARGFSPGTNRHTFNAYGNLIGMLLVRALDRARRVEEAMLCRGYQGRFPYAALPSPAARDWAGFAAVAGLAVTVLVVDRL